MYLKRFKSRLVPVSRSAKRQIMDTWRHIPSRLSVRISSVTGDVLSGAKNVWYTTCSGERTGHFVSDRLDVRVWRFLNCLKCKNLMLYAGQTLLLSYLPVLFTLRSFCSLLSSYLFFIPFALPFCLLHCFMLYIHTSPPS